MKLEQLDHFGIEVNRLAEAEQFYTNVLGLTVVAHLGDLFDWALELAQG